MTEKRFKTNEVGCIVDYYDNNLKNYDGQEIVDLLNALHEENKALKQTIKKMGELGGFNKHMIKTICGDLE